MERVENLRTRRRIPALTVEKSGRICFNPPAMDLLNITRGDPIYIYWDDESKVVAIEPHEEGDYTLGCRGGAGRWGAVSSKPLCEHLEQVSRGQYLVTVEEHPDDPGRKLLQADLS